MAFFASSERRLRRDARNWLEIAEKVYHYRRDQLGDAQRDSLRRKIADLKEKLSQRAEPAKLKLAADALEPDLRASGGRIYPKTALVENVEFFLVAAILLIGITRFFVQPFKIPTNSMWPSYYGMTTEVFKNPAQEPGAVERAFRFFAFGAVRKTVDAPTAGEVFLPFEGNFSTGEFKLADQVVRGRKWLILPTALREHVVRVGDQVATFRVPVDLDTRSLFEQLAGGPGEWRRLTQRAFAIAAAERKTSGVVWVPLGKTVRQGERVLAFDVLTGDQLFVDRVTYHFRPPQVGEGFVFRTGQIPGIHAQYGDQYYVKRLVGVPGDTLEIRAPVLYRNGAPIEGAAAFGSNARREGLYPGYVAAGLLQTGERLTVPETHFFAMGDNSPNSSDGRMWGFVPGGSVVGRPIFVYYPFTRRWGPAR